MMLAGEEVTAGEPIHGRPGVPAWNEDPFLLAAVRLPTDRDPVSGIFT